MIPVSFGKTRVKVLYCPILTGSYIEIITNGRMLMSFDLDRLLELFNSKRESDNPFPLTKSQRGSIDRFTG